MALSTIGLTQCNQRTAVLPDLWWEDWEASHQWFPIYQARRGMGGWTVSWVEVVAESHAGKRQSFDADKKWESSCRSEAFGNQGITKGDSRPPALRTG